jgi:hypothetical protein
MTPRAEPADAVQANTLTGHGNFRKAKTLDFHEGFGNRSITSCVV